MTVGGDFVAVATGPRAAVLVTQSSLVSLIAERRDLPIASGDRTTASHLTMRRVMFGMAADRPRVSLLATGAPEATTGTLRSTGVDVCSVQLDGVERRVAHVFLHSVVEVVLLDG